MAHPTFKMQAPDGKEVEITVYPPDELERLCRDEDKAVKNIINTMLKYFGVPTPEILRMKDPLKKKTLVLKGYADHGAPTNGQVKLRAVPAPEAAPAEAPVAARKEAPPAEASKPASNGAAAASTAASNIGSSEIAQLLKAMSKKIDTLTEKIAALEEAEEARAEQDGLRNQALVDIHENLGEVIKTTLETHFLTRMIAPQATGLDESDLAGCYHEFYAQYLVPLPAYADSVLVETEDEAGDETGGDAGDAPADGDAAGNG
jgi:hypothetical protein